MGQKPGKGYDQGLIDRENSGTGILINTIISRAGRKNQMPNSKNRASGILSAQGQGSK
jgi:hypothetical protein